METCPRNEFAILRGVRGLAGLTFIRRALKIHNTGKNQGEGQSPNQGGHSRRKITYQHRCAATDGAEQIQSEDGPAMPEAKIRKPVSRMVFPRSEEHTSELQSQSNLVCRLLLEKKNRLRDNGCGAPQR